MLQVHDRGRELGAARAAVGRAAAIAAAIAAVGLSAPPAFADDADGGAVIDVNGHKHGLYPIAVPTVTEGDAAVGKQVAEIASFDFSVAGVFKVLDPASFLDTQSGALTIDPAKWTDVGAYGVMKYRVGPDAVEFALFDVAKGNQAVLTDKIARRGDIRPVVHRWCNEVVKYYTGEPGFFGSKIVFEAKGKSASSIVAMDFDGVNAYPVSHNSAINMFPAWSPSGAQILYTSFMRDNPDLYVASSAGGRPKRISSRPGMNTGGAWSPDGSQIAVTLSSDGNPEIYIIKASDGSIVRRLTNNKAIDTSPAWSPDGSQIAFVSDRNGGPQIFVVPVGGGNARQVSTNGNYNTTPTWSPRPGKHVLAYTTRDGGTYDIVTLDLDSNAMTRITQNEGQNEEPAFSPNGRAIAFARAGQGVFIANAGGGGKAVKVWNGSATGIDWGPFSNP